MHSNTLKPLGRRWMLGLLLLLGTLIGVLAPAPDVARAADIYTVDQDGLTVPETVIPLTVPGKSTSAYYGYSSGDSSSHTGLEENGVSYLFLYEDHTVSPSKMSLIITHDAIGGGGGGKVYFDIAGVDITARKISSDDPGEFNVNYNSGTATGRWNWLDCCTDGGAMYLGSNPVDITITPRFFSGIDQWFMIVGNGKVVELDMTKPVRITSTGVDSDLDDDGYDTDAVGGGDCDDNNAAVNPGAPEIIGDGIDNDCNSATPDDPDADGDGYSLIAGLDCDDNNAAVNPGAPEIIGDGIDNDCNSATPDDPDADGDGYSLIAGLDCDDNNAAVNPGAPEIIGDGIDNDCNSATPDDPDADGDGYSLIAGLDCDDNNAAVNPGAPEIIGDGIDNDCNSATPDDPDADGDGYSLIAGLDCDDNNAAVNPGAPEIIGDGIDNDCNSATPDDPDADGDGYSLIAGLDCDDNNAAVNPGAAEVSDGVDNDCDGILTKGDVLIISGIDNGGIRTAPGLLKPFNPDSNAGDKAGKKK